MNSYFRKAVGNEGLLLPGYLVPTCDVGIKIIQRMDQAANDEAWVDHTLGRNPANHRRFFSLVKKTFDMQDQYTNEKVWLQRIKWMAGHFDTFVNPDGKLIYVVKSIRFDSLKEDAFRILFKNAVDGFFEFYGPSLKRAEFMEILEYD